MRILTRYILFDLLKVFLFTLLGMTVFVFLVLIGKEAVDNGLGLVPVLRMLPYLLPQAMQFAVPGTMLLATTSVYGRVAASNEIVAIKSLGISPMVMMWPTLILATVVSFGAVVLNDVAVSWGHGGVQRVLFESLEEIVYGRLRTTGSFTNGKLSVTVKKVAGKKLIQPTFLLFQSGGEPAWTITADEAEIRANEDRTGILLILQNAEMDFGGSGKSVLPGEEQYEISLAEFSGQRNSSRSPANYSMREIGPSKIEQKALISQLDQELAADAAHAMMTGRMFELSEDMWQDKENSLAQARNKLYRLSLEPHRRWANGFSCLFFVLIGAPMAVRLRHGEFWGSFFACFSPILLVYYPLLVGCLDKAKSGEFPAEAVWMGNLVLAIWGVWLMRRVIRF
ncbi:MAG: YjgP/YjgQ family permease [Planctomycetes bacterium]|nr:YjgP/YjgQ family permease [Planctomycetota bacterium]